jgi:hypothetical protein
MLLNLSKLHQKKADPRGFLEGVYSSLFLKFKLKFK